MLIQSFFLNTTLPFCWNYENSNKCLSINLICHSLSITTIITMMYVEDLYKTFRNFSLNVGVIILYSPTLSGYFYYAYLPYFICFNVL